MIQIKSPLDSKTRVRNLNNFDFLRFFGAFLIIFSHSYPLSGHREPIIVDRSLGGIGVSIFFIISGYLVTQSWLNNPSIIQYSWKRFLRIMPGLVVLTIFTILVIGPIVTTIPLYEYFSNPQTRDYLKTLLIFAEPFYFLPGVFVNNPLPYSINGSLWMLPYLITCYGILALLGYTKVLNKRKLVIVLFVFIIILDIFYVYSPTQTIIHDFLGTELTTILLIYFLSGVLFCLYQDKIKYNYKIAILFSTTLIVFAFLQLSNIISIYRYVYSFTFPYLIFYFAFLTIKRLNNFGKFGDFSYGLFIYAFPVQQTIAHFLQNISVGLMFFLTLLVTLPLSVLSWYFIEAKALKYKNVFR